MRNKNCNWNSIFLLNETNCIVIPSFFFYFSHLFFHSYNFITYGCIYLQIKVQFIFRLSCPFWKVAKLFLSNSYKCIRINYIYQPISGMCKIYVYIRFPDSEKKVFDRNQIGMNDIYSETCLNRTSLESTFMFRIGRYSGWINKYCQLWDFICWDSLLNSLSI